MNHPQEKQEKKCAMPDCEALGQSRGKNSNHGRRHKWCSKHRNGKRKKERLELVKLEQNHE